MAVESKSSNNTDNNVFVVKHNDNNVYFLSCQNKKVSKQVNLRNSRFERMSVYKSFNNVEN